MLISYSHNFIFIHIVKAAGSSVTATLTPYANRPETRLPNRIIRKLGLDIRLPGKYREFPVHIWAARLRDRVPASFFDNAFKFTFVRNPWDWQVSLYHWYLDHPEHLLHDKISKMTFEDYARWRADTPPLYYQRNYIVDEKDDVLVDYIGRFETLVDDFSEVCRRIGVRNELQQVNVTLNRAGRDYRTYYTDTTAELIRRTYERDIMFFNYHFE